jgi:purine-binding chemotaxis protein CheW
MSETPLYADWESLARAAGGVHGPAPVPDAERQLLAFSLAGGRYALPVERVREIARLRPITPVPRLPAAVLGVVSLRGEIVQVIDLRRRLGIESAPQPEGAGRIVVVYAGDAGVAGLRVDRVSEVMRVPETAIRPSAADAGAVEALCSRGESFVSLLDLEKVLDLDAGR